MADTLSPGTSVDILRKGPVALPGVSNDIGGFAMATLKGPVNTPVLITSTEDFAEVFGAGASGSFGPEALRDFFKGGDGGDRCYVSRVAHYSDITDPSTLTAVVASLVLQTSAGSATVGSMTSSPSSFPAILAAGDTFLGRVDGNTAQTLTITATRASITGSGATYAAVTASHTLKLTVSGYSATQTITFSGSENDEASFLATINSQLVGGAAIDSSSQVKLETDQMGSGAAIAVLNTSSADVLASLGLTASTASGSGNVANVAAVTAAELAGLFQSTFTNGGGSTAVANVNNSVTWSSVTTGTGGIVQLSSGTGVSKIAGFDTSAHAGSTGSGAQSTIELDASSPGAWGNAYKVLVTNQNTSVTTAAAVSAGTYTQLTVASTSRLSVGDTISIVAGGGTVRGIVSALNSATKQVTFASAVTVPVGGLAGTEAVVSETFTITVYDNTDSIALNGSFSGLRMSPLAGANYVVNAINSTFRTPVNATDLFATADDPRPAVMAKTAMSSGSDGGSITSTDYTGDLAGQLGIYAFDKVSDVNMVSIPGISTVAVWQAMETYSNHRADLMVIPDFPQGLSPTEALTFLQSTANVASMFMAVYYPWVKMVDSVSGVTISVPNSGHAQGIYAKVARERNFGKAPAGVPDGVLSNVVGVDYDVKQADYDSLYPANINAIQVFKGEGIAIFGSRTLDPTGEFGQISAVRTVITLKRQLKSGTRFVNFENNNEDLRGRVDTLVSQTLRQYRLDGILQGANDKEAFFVICDATNNTAPVIAAGKLVCRIGVALARPAEFVIFTIEQDTRALQQQVASSQ